jgi:hypothetical protein
MINYDETEFPPLDSVYGYEYKLNNLFFNLSRKTDDLELSKTKELFSSLLLDYKDDDSKIDLLFKLILYTRDIGKGKGEQLLSYMMIFEFYKIFPNKAYKLLELFVWQYGSWRDIPYLCDYISKTTSRQDDAFIIKAVNIMNDQLHKDMKKCGNEVITTAAKWVPREGSKFSWLFDLLMENWTKRYCPYIFSTVKTSEQMIKARYKASANYRKVFTTLSRKLNLVETKLCNRVEFYDIDPLMINKKTMSKQWNPSFDMEFTSDVILKSPNYYSGKSSINVGQNISWLVEISLKTPIDQIDRINKLWKNTIVNKNFGACIPIIDISSSVEKTGNLYFIIGNAVLIAKHSSVSGDGIRILFLSNEPLWYKNDSNCDDYVSIIKDIFDFLPPFTNSDILSGFSFLTKSISASTMKSKYVDTLSFVIMTDKGFSFEIHHEIESLFHNNNNNVEVPKIVYWNISNKHVEMDPGFNVENTESKNAVSIKTCNEVGDSNLHWYKKLFFISGIDSSNFDIIFEILRAKFCFSQLDLIHFILFKYLIV